MVAIACFLQWFYVENKLLQFIFLWLPPSQALALLNIAPFPLTKKLNPFAFP